MSKAQTEAKLQDRFTYLLNHCDTDEETATVKWVASHMADEFGLRALILKGEVIPG